MNDYGPFIEKIGRAERVILFPHGNVDGDAVGSCVALALAVRSMGKKCIALMNEAVPAYLSFLEQEDKVFFTEPPYAADLAIAVDCGDEKRFEKKKEYFEAAPESLCIDHHLKDTKLADYEVVETAAAATGILVYELLIALGTKITREMAQAIYVAILTDTGSFRFSNADPRALRTAAELYQYGIDNAALCTAIYDSYPAEQLKLDAAAVNAMEVFAGGKAVISNISQETIKSLGAAQEMTETAIDRLRSVDTAEIAAFIREMKDGTYKVSLRAKTYANVNRIAKRFGGGGHVKASGCTFSCSLEEAVSRLKAAIEEELSQWTE